MTIERFIVAVESIAASLSLIAGGAGIPAKTSTVTVTETTETPAKAEKPARAARTTKAADPTPEPAAAAAAEPAKTPEPAAPAFEYTTLQKSVIALASAGAAGKEAALRILTDAGLERGQKASDAASSKWPGMHEQAVAALAALNDAGEMA